MPKKEIHRDKSGRNLDRQVDKTYLSLDKAEERGLQHRDFFAHGLRWSHILKYLQRSGQYKTASILDIGCGPEVPLAKRLYVNKMAPKYYLGVDVNKLETPDMIQRASNKKWFNLLGQTSATKLTRSTLSSKQMILTGSSLTFPRPNVVVALECLEHMHPKLTRQTLEVIRQVMTSDGVAFISTPCFNGKAAGNHINEMTYQALGALIEDLDFEIQAHYGTFASISDYVDQLESDSECEGQNVRGHVTAYDAFLRLREYYDTNVLAVIFAPLYPHLSRNCLWELRPGLKNRKFSVLAGIPQPWSQHPDFLELAGPKGGKK